MAIFHSLLTGRNVYVIYTLMTILMHFKSGNADFFADRPSSIFPDDYDKFEPPWKEGYPAHVYIALLVLDVDRVDDEKMEYSVQCYIDEAWKDDRLNLSSYQQNTGDEKSIFPMHLMTYIWEPSLIFPNIKDGKVGHLSVPNIFIKVSKNGYLKKTTRYSFIIGCQMDFHLYPVDTQKCHLQIKTLANPITKAALHWMEDKTDEGQKSIVLVYPVKPLKFELLIPVPYGGIEEWPDGNYSYLRANFTFIRLLSGNLLNVYIPSTLVVFLSWISFWVDIEAVPARVTLGVTSLLTLGTQVAQARAGLPAISYMTAMDVWLFACLLTVFSALLEFSFAYQIFILNKQCSVVDASHRQDDVSKSELKVFRERIGTNVFPQNGYHSGTLKDASKKSSDFKNIKYLDDISRKVFPLAFVLFSLVYWIYYLYLK